jgi:hypothetical protein
VAPASEFARVAGLAVAQEDCMSAVVRRSAWIAAFVLVGFALLPFVADA